MKARTNSYMFQIPVHLIATLLLLHFNNHIPGALAFENDNGWREEERDIKDQGEPTEFLCNTVDGKFRVTTGPSAVVRYGYEMEYLQVKAPMKLASNVTHFITQSVLSSLFEGCTNSEDRRLKMQIQDSAASPILSHPRNSSGPDRALITGDDILVGFESTPEVEPVWEVECQNPSPDRRCMVFGGGVTIYFPPDDGQGRRLKGSAEDAAVEKTHKIVKDVIESGEIPEKVDGVEGLIYISLPEPTSSPSAMPTIEPTAVPSTEPSISSEPSAVPSTEPSAVPSSEPSGIPLDRPTSSPSDVPSETTKVKIPNRTTIVIPPSETSKGTPVPPWAWTLLGISLLVGSGLGTMYVRKRYQIKGMKGRQGRQAEEIIEADLLDSSQKDDAIVDF